MALSNLLDYQFQFYSTLPQLSQMEKLRLTEVNFLTKITIQDLNAGSLTLKECSASILGGQGKGDERRCKEG